MPSSRRSRPMSAAAEAGVRIDLGASQQAARGSRAALTASSSRAWAVGACPSTSARTSAIWRACSDSGPARRRRASRLPQSRASQRGRDRGRRRAVGGLGRELHRSADVPDAREPRRARGAASRAMSRHDSVPRGRECRERRHKAGTSTAAAGLVSGARLKRDAFVPLHVAGASDSMCAACEARGDSGVSADASELHVIEVRCNASLTRGQALAFFAVTLVASLVIALFWTFKGFWPVLPFAGLELFVLGVALGWSMRRGSYRELITISPEEVTIERGMTQARERERMPRTWARVELVQATIRGTRAGCISARTGGATRSAPRSSRASAAGWRGGCASCLRRHRRGQACAAQARTRASRFDERRGSPSTFSRSRASARSARAMPRSCACARRMGTQPPRRRHAAQQGDSTGSTS